MESRKGVKINKEEKNHEKNEISNATLQSRRQKFKVSM